MKRIYYVLICFVLALSVIACKKKNDNKVNQEDVGNLEATITPTIAPTSTPMVDDEEDDSEIEEEKIVSKEEAEELILSKLEERGYFLQYINDIVIEKLNYYEFSISSSGEAIEPNILVNKVTGELGILEDNKVLSIQEHPLLNGASVEEIKDANSNESNSNNSSEDDNINDVFSKEDALDKLLLLPKEKLNLPAGLEEYTIIYDDWTTVIQGKECYGINAFAKAGDRMINMGVFFVATDGSTMYQFDVEADDFVEIK